MQSREKQFIEASERVLDFVVQHPVRPPASYGYPKELLDEVVQKLTDHSTTQVSGARLGKASTQQQKTLKKILREQHLRPIMQIANATLKGSPGIDKATRMPSAKMTTTQLLATARAFHEVAAQYEQQFIKAGRPADFLKQLENAITNVQATLLGGARQLGKKVGARAGLKDEIARGRAAILMLDAIVNTTFAGNGDVLAKWRSARRIRGVSGPAVGSTAAPVGSSVAATAAAAPASPAGTTKAA